MPSLGSNLSQIDVKQSYPAYIILTNKIFISIYSCHSYKY